MHKYFFNSFFTLLMFSTSGIFAQIPRNVAIEDVSSFGGGCRQEDISVSISRDKQALTVIFDDYILEHDGRRQRRGSRKICSLKLSLKVSPGWSLGFFDINIRGYADVANRMVGSHQVYYKMGRGITKFLGTTKFKGPFEGDYQKNYSMPLNRVTWSKCSTFLEPIDFTLQTLSALKRKRRNIAPTNGSLLTVDSLDGEFKQKYGVVWKKCSPNDDPIDGCDDVFGDGYGCDGGFDP